MRRNASTRGAAAVLVLVATLGVAVAQLSASRHAGATVAAAQVTTGELSQNGGFESGYSPWRAMAGTNLAVYANGQLSSGDAALAGTHYGATNTSAAGGGIYEDISDSVNAGDTICGNAEVRDQLNETGASGQFVIWLLGGSSSENSVASFSHLGTGSNWQQVSTCATATTSHSDVRIQFYPTPGAPTVDIDAVDVHDALNVQQSVSQNGGFETGYAPWQEMPNTNFVVYANGQLAPGDTAFAGTHYAATNTAAAGGGIYDDTSGLTINAGDTFCGTAEVRSQLNSAGANGSFVVWLLGGSRSENGVASYSNLGNGSNWTQMSECVTATVPHSVVRVQFYPNVGSATLNADAVSVHDNLDVQTSLSQNGSFESGYAPWQEMPNTNFVVYPNGQLSPGDSAYSGLHYAATNTSAAGGGIYQDISGLSIHAGDSICGSAEVRNQLNESGASGSFVIWLLGGSAANKGSAAFSNLGVGQNWRQVTTCVTATTAQSDVRIQFYPNAGAPTVDVDAAEVDGVAGSSNAACTPNNSCTPQTFADTLLSQPGVNAPITASNEYAIETWELAEGGGAGCPGQPPRQSPWRNSSGPAGNPLNTTQPEPGSTNWNSVGVKIYSDGNGQTCWYWGVLATTQTITGPIGNYGPILAAFRNPVLDNQSQCDRVAVAVGNSEWGTGNFSVDC